MRPFGVKPKNKTMRAWPKADNIIPQYHTTWSGLLHFCTSKDEMKMSFISLSLFIIMLSITLVGSMQALIQIRYFIKCAINVRPLSCWSLYMM